MRVFLCWSGTLSRSVAEILHDYLELSPLPIQVGFSPVGIASGEKWPNWLDRAFEDTSYGWLVLTRENLDSKWIHFEAGALTKGSEDARVCPLLVDISESDVAPPLSFYQSNRLDEAGLFKALSDLNHQLGTSAIDGKTLKKSFDQQWPDISASIENARAELTQGDLGPHRTEREVLDEILSYARTNWGLGRFGSMARRESGEIRFQPGERVFHPQHRIGKFHQLSADGLTALVMFDNSNTSSSEPVEVIVEHLSPVW